MSFRVLARAGTTARQGLLRVLSVLLGTGLLKTIYYYYYSYDYYCYY